MTWMSVPAVHPSPMGPEPHFLSFHAGRCLHPCHPHALVHVTVNSLFKPLLPAVPSQGTRIVRGGGSTAMRVLLGVLWLPPGRRAQDTPVAPQWDQVLHGWRCAGSVRRGPEGTSPRTPGPCSPFCLPGGAKGPRVPLPAVASGLRPQWCRERTVGVQVALEAQSAYGNF